MSEMFIDVGKLYKFNEVKDIDNTNLAFMIKWLNNEVSNMPTCLKLNKHFFWMDKEIMKYAFHFGVNKNKKWIKNLKKEQIEDEYEWLKPYIQELYGWTDREIELNWQNVKLLLEWKDYKIMLDKKYGFDKKQCNLLKIDYIEPDFKDKKLEGLF